MITTHMNQSEIEELSIDDKFSAISVKEEETMSEIFDSLFDVLSDIQINVIFIGFEV